MNENFTIEIEQDERKDDRYWLYITSKETGDCVAIHIQEYEFEMLKILGVR